MKQSYKILLYILISFAMIVEIMLLLFCKLSVLDKIYIYSALIAQVLTIIGLIIENYVLNDIGHVMFGLCTTLIIFAKITFIHYNGFINIILRNVLIGDGVINIIHHHLLVIFSSI